MGHIIGFALLIAGYTLVDWGHYAVKGQRVSMWYLLSGIESAGPRATNQSVGGVGMKVPTPRPSRQQ